MKRDISAILKEWPYTPGQVNARMVTGADGLERVQVRLDLGILQMYADGRPDGERPFGFPSLLEYFEAKLDEAQADARDHAGPPDEGDEEGEGPERRRKGRAGEGALAGGDDEGTPTDDTPHESPHDTPHESPHDTPHEAGAGGDGTSGVGSPGGAATTLTLDEDACRALREEAAQYYQRYVACLALDEFERVVRDTTRNLRVLDLCAKHAGGEHDRTVLEQFRPYILMVRARALASQSIRENELRCAMLALDEALDRLKRYYTEMGKPQLFHAAEEVKMLHAMREALVPKLPISQKAELRQRLQRALETENYELAAILRDELKQLKE